MTETFTVSGDVIDLAVEGVTAAIIKVAYETLSYDDASMFIDALDRHFELLNNELLNNQEAN
tara:strand:- start:1492 stop:1677 length:186 start_codon:yes stop_codon:yes gene_type:complete